MERVRAPLPSLGPIASDRPMALRQDDNRPNRRLGLINLLLIGLGTLLLLSNFLTNTGSQVPRVP